jgi:hypothetical protein
MAVLAITMRALVLLLACAPLACADKKADTHEKLVVGIVASPGMAMLKVPTEKSTTGRSADALAAKRVNNTSPEWTGVDHISKWDLTGFAPDIIPGYSRLMGYSPE